MNNLATKIISILIVIIVTPFNLLPLFIKKLFGNLIISLLFGVLVYEFLSIDYLSGFLTIILFLTGLSMVLDYRLIKEGIINQFSLTYGNFRFNQLIQKYKKSNEKFSVSPAISMNDKKYRVIEFGNYNFNPTDSKKLVGFLVLSEDGKLLSNINESNKLVNIYLFWRKIYFNPILGKNIKKNHKPLLKFWLNFQNKFKEIIDERQKEGYKKVSKIEDKKFVKILNELDNEVLEQYPFVTKKLRISIEIFDQIYDIFLYPSKEFYHKLFNEIDTIVDMGNEENKIWTKRLRNWENLYLYYDIKLNKMPEPKVKWLLTGLLGDLINFFILKQQLYLVGGGTIAGFTIESGKKIKKDTLRYLNRVLFYHKMGIDAIKKNIEINKSLKNVRDEYKQILSSNNISKIRN